MIPKHGTSLISLESHRKALTGIMFDAGQDSPGLQCQSLSEKNGTASPLVIGWKISRLSLTQKTPVPDSIPRKRKGLIGGRPMLIMERRVELHIDPKQQLTMRLSVLEIPGIIKSRLKENEKSARYFEELVEFLRD